MSGWDGSLLESAPSTRPRERAVRLPVTGLNNMRTEKTYATRRADAESSANAMVEQIPVPALVLELVGAVRVSAINRDACMLFGSPEPDQTRAYVAEMMRSETGVSGALPFVRMVSEGLSSGSGRLEFDWLTWRLDGEKLDLHVYLELGSVAAEPKRILCVLQDRGDQRRAQCEAALYKNQLQQVLESRARQVEYAYGELWRYADIVGKLVDVRDLYAKDHMPRVSRLAVLIADGMGLGAGVVEQIRLAAAFHDVGKAAVPTEILNKHGALSEGELALVREHVVLGERLLMSVGARPELVRAVAQHHEREDGSGYPRQLTQGDICLYAKILAVADTVESMCADRAHRIAPGIEAACDELASGKGRLYDRTVVDVALRIIAPGSKGNLRHHAWS